jgi:energy-coupling factor transport system permease protein
MLINFPYIKRDSFVHGLDPRTKLILLFVFIFTVTQSSNFWFVLAGLITAILYYRQARLTWKETKRAWIYVITLALTLVIVNYLVTSGAVVQGMDLSQQHILSRLPFFHFIGKPPFVAAGALIVSVESITFVLTQIMRNISIGLFVVPVTYTIDPAQMGVAFRGMGISDNIAYAIDLSLRFLPSVTRDFTTTYDAQRARGFEIDKLRGGIFARIARLAPMIVPVIIGSIVDAEDIINAMELRCFGVGKRTWLIQLHPRRIDLFLLLSALILFVVVTVLNILGNFAPLAGIYFLHTQGIPRFLL